MKTIWKAFFVALLILAGGCMEENDKCKDLPAGVQNEQYFTKQITKSVSINYLLFLPEDYGKTDQPWPLMMFLHGAGERGDDLNQVKVHGPAKIVESKKDFGFIVVSPQCSKNTWWPNETDALINLLDEIINCCNVDRDRVYLTGLSMGGYGTWTLACKYPNRFAAIAPICGGGEPLLSGQLKHIPTWAFHGAKDNVVPLEKSEEMVKAVQAAGGDAKLTVYPEAGHDSWTETYDNPELYEWFLKHRRNK